MNVGCVTYKKDFTTGQLTANWHFENDNEFIGGTGKASGDPGWDYSGNYCITYVTYEGKVSKPLDLTIKQKDNFYVLYWYRNDVLKYSGIGMLVNDCLVAGYNLIV